MQRILAAAVLVLAAVASALALRAAPAHADGGGRGDRAEARIRVTCTRGSRLSLRLRARDGNLTIDLELEQLRNRGPWNLIVLHERQLVVRTTLRPSAGRTSVQIRRIVPDWYGTDSVVSRASGPVAERCAATVSV